MAIKTLSGASDGKNLPKNEKIISKQKLSELSIADLVSLRLDYNLIPESGEFKLLTEEEYIKVMKSLGNKLNIDWDN
jgi:hypothetical protein